MVEIEIVERLIVAGKEVLLVRSSSGAVELICDDDVWEEAYNLLF